MKLFYIAVIVVAMFLAQINGMILNEKILQFCFILSFKHTADNNFLHCKPGLFSPTACVSVGDGCALQPLSLICCCEESKPSEGSEADAKRKDDHSEESDENSAESDEEKNGDKKDDDENTGDDKDEKNNTAEENRDT